jgi:hypothetical protein
LEEKMCDLTDKLVVTLSLASALLLVGCANTAGGSCSSAAECTDGHGLAGICEPTGYCSFFDASCSSGRRYSPLAGKGLAGSCIASAPVDSVDDLGTTAQSPTGDMALATSGDMALATSGDMDPSPRDMGPGMPPAGGANTLCSGAAAASACQGQYLFCDSFEAESGAKLSAWDDTVVDGSHAELDVSQARACRGSRALEAAAAGANAHAFAVKQLAVPSTVYLRTAVYVEPGSSMAWVNLMGIQSSTRTAEIALRFTGQGGKMTIARSFGASTAETPAFNAITPGRWSCVEMRVDTDSKRGKVAVMVDGKEVASFDDFPTIGNGARSYDQVLLGIDQTGQTAPVTWYIDELAVSSSPIGCD